MSVHSMNGSVQRYSSYIPATEYISSKLYTASRPRIPNQLQGPGILKVPTKRTSYLSNRYSYFFRSTVSSHACFRNYLVDISVRLYLLPNRTSERLLNSIHYASIKEVACNVPICFTHFLEIYANTKREEFH